MEGSSGPPQEIGTPSGGADLISALPDDLLLLVLARLPCAAAAARTGVLSRRWCGLWPRLRQIVFSNVPFCSLEPVLGRFPGPPHAVSLIHIRVPEKGNCKCQRHLQLRPQTVVGSLLPLLHPVPGHLIYGVDVTSLLRAAARLEPEEFFFHLPSHIMYVSRVVDLPCFHRATSIVLNFPSFRLHLPAGVEFPALETLSLSCYTADIDRLLSSCPRLRTLRFNHALSSEDDLTVNSASLQELLLDTGAARIYIVAPVLKQLTMTFFAWEGSISILAIVPMVHKVQWNCNISRAFNALGVWQVEQVTLKTAERYLPSMHVHARTNLYNFLDEDEGHTFTQEIEQLMITGFSVLELHLTTNGHVFGAFAFLLLGMNRICSATQRLKIIIQKSEVKQECSPHCQCESIGWRSQTISLTALEEVEINGFGGDDHEIDFLKVIYKCAPMLKKMIVKLSDEASLSNDGCTDIYNTFKAYSSVELYVHLTSGLVLGSQNCLPWLRLDPGAH